MPMVTLKLVEDFIIPSLNDERFGDKLQWDDSDKNIFLLRWIHKSGTTWNSDDTIVFQEWDKIKGRYHPEMPDYFTLAKQRFRSALYKLSSIIELDSVYSNSKVYFKKYQIVLEESKKRRRPKRGPKRNLRLEQQVPVSPSKAYKTNPMSPANSNFSDHMYSPNQSPSPIADHTYSPGSITSNQSPNYDVDHPYSLDFATASTPSGIIRSQETNLASNMEIYSDINLIHHEAIPIIGSVYPLQNTIPSALHLEPTRPCFLADLVRDVMNMDETQVGNIANTLMGSPSDREAQYDEKEQLEPLPDFFNPMLSSFVQEPLPDFFNPMLSLTDILSNCYTERPPQL